MRPIFAMTALALLLTACGGSKAEAPHADSSNSHDESHTHHPVPAPAAGEDVRADFIGTDGEKTGELVLTDGPHGMLLRVDLRDIEHGFHGMHLHQVANCSDYAEGFKASGAHVNPDGKEHGLLNPNGFERADLPNIYAQHNNHARAELFVYGLTLADAMDEDGFAIVVHENADDHLTQPIGGAGPRIACAAIGG